MPMPMQLNDRLISTVDRLMLAVALTVLLILPMGYSVLAYRSLVDRVDSLARVKAAAITDLVSGNPGLWVFQVQRIEHLLTLYPVPTEAAPANDEAASVYDANGVLLVLAGNPPQELLLRRSHPIHDSGRVVGRVEVVHSLRGLIVGTALAGLLGLSLGGALYGVFRAWPRRLLRQMGEALEAERVALRESEQRYRTLIEWSPEAMVVYRRNKVLYVNPAGVALLGRTSAQDAASKNILDFIHPDSHQLALARVKMIADGANPPMAEMKFLKLDGTVIDVEVQSTSIAFDGKPATCSNIRDITERKRAQAALLESEARFRSLTEMSSDFYWESDALHRFTQRSESKREAAESAFPEASSLGKCRWEIPYSSPEESGWQKHRVTLDAHLPFRNFEISRRRPNGAEYHNSVSGDPVFSAAGEFKGYRGIGSDITERKQAEAIRASLEAQLRESQKMEAIGTLAGGIAHDFNNILATILGNAELARQDASANPLALESLEEIRKAGSRGRDLVQQILSFSRRQPTERKPTVLAPIIEESVRLLRATLPARIALDVHCEAEAPPVHADATQILQIVINLVTNAMQAMPGGPGRIGIRLDTVLLDAALAEAHPVLAVLHACCPGRTLRLAVSDNGPGIDAVTLTRIFEPFFTTKAVDEGTGLGLPVVHGIVQTHQGAIDVTSQPGRGSTFTVYLPVAEVHSSESRPAESVAAPSAAPGGGIAIGSDRHILYLDDDESLVFLVTRLLERRGFRVSGFIDQRQALDALRADPAAFDLMVTDYNMPGMSGLDAVRAARAIRADLPVAIASGFIDEALRAEADGAGVHELILKANAVEDMCAAFARLALTVGSGSTCS